MSTSRRQASFSFRMAAAELARDRAHPPHRANGDEQRFANASYGMSFTKGLAHHEKTGLVCNGAHYEALRAAIDNGYIEPFSTSVPVPAAPTDRKRRQWEAPTAGVAFDLEGPDAHAVTMPPAPALGSDELEFEMAEVYELAVVRDVPFAAFVDAGQAPSVTGAKKVDQSAKRLGSLAYAKAGFPGRPRTTKPGQIPDDQTIFRGSSPGVDVGPYLSQFLLVGTKTRTGESLEQGYIEYGANVIDQRVAVAKKGQDYMQTESDWLAVQNGFSPNIAETFSGRRFISTPRDLATYVHFDQLYQAYLNACLILLGMGTPTDPAFDALSGAGKVYDAAGDTKDRNAGGFALYGGPHILSLVTEVATRALKAVRYQKFNTHMRLRPEALAGRLQHAAAIAKEYPALGAGLEDMKANLKSTLMQVRKLNAKPNGKNNVDYLPMAFPEGSPMHPAYGAGHATVAGACVTILKAFFDTSAVFVTPKGAGSPAFKNLEPGDAPAAFISDYGVSTGSGAGKGKGETLHALSAPPLLTLEGELNKLAANISIGRNMAGVHFYTDYYDSARMGEQIAIGLLEEQALGYPTDRFVLSLRTFDGDAVRIGAR